MDVFNTLSAQLKGMELQLSHCAPIVSSATFNGETLASLGFTQTSGVLSIWTLNGTTESIQVFLGAPATAAVPGPLAWRFWAWAALPLPCVPAMSFPHAPQLGTLLGFAVSAALGAGIACGGPGVVRAFRPAGGGGTLEGAVA